MQRYLLILLGFLVAACTASAPIDIAGDITQSAQTPLGQEQTVIHHVYNSLPNYDAARVPPSHKMVGLDITLTGGDQYLDLDDLELLLENTTLSPYAFWDVIYLTASGEFFSWNRPIDLCGDAMRLLITYPIPLETQLVNLAHGGGDPLTSQAVPLQARDGTFPLLPNQRIAQGDETQRPPEMQYDPNNPTPCENQ